MTTSSAFSTLGASLKAKSSSYPYPVLKRINLNLQAAVIFASQSVLMTYIRL